MSTFLLISSPHEAWSAEFSGLLFRCLTSLAIARSGHDRRKRGIATVLLVILRLDRRIQVKKGAILFNLDYPIKSGNDRLEKEEGKTVKKFTQKQIIMDS